MSKGQDKRFTGGTRQEFSAQIYTSLHVKVIFSFLFSFTILKRSIVPLYPKCQKSGAIKTRFPGQVSTANSDLFDFLLTSK